MPPSGVLQPSERIVYANGELMPRYIRRVYVFEGLSQLGLDPDDTAIKGLCQSASGTPLPGDGDTLQGLPMIEMDVVRYSESRGEATVAVQWGSRYYASGAAPDVRREQSLSLPPLRIDQPFGVAFTGVGPAPLLEIRERAVYRTVVRTSVSRLMDEAQANALFQSTIAQNLQSRMQWRGIERVIIGGNIRGVGQTQAYLSVYLDYLGPVAEIPQGRLYVQGEHESLRVAPLAVNEEYTRPNLAVGTAAIPADQVYPNMVTTFTWLVS
ncbi:MAG: hypothetical protein ACX94C_11765 [Phycisphaerales bacterium]